MIQLHSIVSFLGFLPEIVIFVMCIIYMSRTKRTEGVLLFTGSLIHVLTRIFYAAIPFFSILSYDDGTNGDLMRNLYLVAGTVTFIGSAIFCVGLVMLIQFALGKISRA